MKNLNYEQFFCQKYAHNILKNKIRKSEEVNTPSTRGTTVSPRITATIQKILGTMRREETDQKEAASLRVEKKNDPVIIKRKVTRKEKRTKKERDQNH